MLLVCAGGGQWDGDALKNDIRLLLLYSTRLKGLKGCIKGLTAIYPECGTKCIQIPTNRNKYMTTSVKIFNLKII